MRVVRDDDRTTAEMKAFFGALHRAWSLGVALRLDV
jgi:hypothetical protein